MGQPLAGRGRSEKSVSLRSSACGFAGTVWQLQCSKLACGLGTNTQGLNLARPLTILVAPAKSLTSLGFQFPVYSMGLGSRAGGQVRRREHQRLPLSLSCWLSVPAGALQVSYVRQGPIMTSMGFFCLPAKNTTNSILRLHGYKDEYNPS